MVTIDRTVMEKATGGCGHWCVGIIVAAVIEVAKEAYHAAKDGFKQGWNYKP